MTTDRTTEALPDSPASAPLLDLQALVVAVRRRRRLWCSMALLGLLAGAAAAVLLRPEPTAVTKVLVTHQADQPNDTGTLIRTDVELLGTTRIAGRALKSLKSTEKPEDFMRDYRGTGLTNNVLEIEVTGESDADAVARAEALADAFVADHVTRMREAAEAESQALLDQRDRVQGELDEVNKSIGDRTPESDPAASASLESLFARRAELNSRIADFDERAAQARTGAPQVLAGTQIVDTPRAVRHSLPRAVGTDAAIGLALGLVLGLGLAAVGTVVADRPVLRREIAAGLGASVIAELRHPPRRPAGRWQRRRTRAARERLTRSLARAVRDGTGPVSLLELGCARGTGAIALDLAGALTAQGPVVVVDGLPDRRMAGLRPKPGAPAVVTAERAAAVPYETRRLGVGSAVPGTVWADLQHLGTRTVLVVRAGHVSTAWLHTVARQLADQLIEVIGVVLLDSDRRDRSDGTLWDGPRTVRADRSERPARPSGAGLPRTERPPMPAARIPDTEQEAR
ncbi:Wzz/FepE/Etk N-terminal domain-containing protein [Streptomyces sp. NBC_01104]|uniref:Wzz/FepE/Etk N-terminal domain-containing protein n=1 Tax=Streptomyces sp. NBC_01104 TaxID=2903750 RepID=UPI0038682538|nr:Wzz/FepE/Etk N-terminal domain-containing protein [Streptomyces sp. NBC_01104]